MSNQVPEPKPKEKEQEPFEEFPKDTNPQDQEQAEPKRKPEPYNPVVDEPLKNPELPDEETNPL